MNASGCMIAGSSCDRTAPVTASLRHVVYNYNGVMIAEFLHKNKSVKILELVADDSFDPQKFDMGVVALLTELKSNNTLTTLKLCNNVVSAQGAEALANSVQVNHTLTCLDISRNDISTEGAGELGAALNVNHTLTTLILQQNNIRGPGAVALFSALSRNCTLSSLDLTKNPIGDEGAAALLALMGEK
mmetsp:Transcript_34031/g.63546  ORF Transcript_34031/g.63546 Transcript_34031/m.63546 type:complete len:188 (+) Transcript_34031:103-666(+)